MIDQNQEEGASQVGPDIPIRPKNGAFVPPKFMEHLHSWLFSHPLLTSTGRGRLQDTSLRWALGPSQVTHRFISLPWRAVDAGNTGRWV